ncbi:hypothetical protein EDD11_002413 [Mortierella claussenii]|nr:hypothetical protein EDD11_002413 [Mortierella claussenii]
MRLSFLPYLTLLGCAIAVLCTANVEAGSSSKVAAKHHTSAKKPSGSHALSTARCVADPELQFFCEQSQSSLNNMIQDVFANIPKHRPGSPRPSNGLDLIRQNGLFADVKHYFVAYWDNLKLIFHGQFGEGIFNQLKNSGSWCEKDNWLVKAAKAGINMLSGGAVTGICECVYPMIRDHKSFKDLTKDVLDNGVQDVLKGCTDNFKKQIKDALKKVLNINQVPRIGDRPHKQRPEHQK